MRHIFIINPMAGKRGSTKKLEADIRALDVPAEIVLTKETGTPAGSPGRRRRPGRTCACTPAAGTAR